jgi:hypothetical protein
MIRSFGLALSAGLVLTHAAACIESEQGSVFIQGALDVNADDDCVANANAQVFRSSGILDIGVCDPAVDATCQNGPNAFSLALKVITNLPATFSSQELQQQRQQSPNFPFYGNTDNNVVTFDQAEVFFTTDADRDGEPALEGDLVPGANNPRLSGVGGSAFNIQTQLSSAAVVFATIVTQEDAAALQAEPFVNERLTAVDEAAQQETLRITANIRLLGKTTGNADVRSPPFPFQVDICRGCLLPQCDAPRVPVAIADVETCFVGQDDRLVVCQDPAPPPAAP